MCANLFYYLNSNRDGCLSVLRASNAIGKSLNSRCDRFFKAEIIDTAYSKVFPRLKYVDEIGYDFTFFNWRISQKSQERAFKKTINKTNGITIANIFGKGKKKEQIFDSIMITQTARPFSIAVASYEDISHCMRNERDSVIAEIPFECLQFIIHPKEDVYFDDSISIDFKAYKNEMISKMLDMGFIETTKQTYAIA